MNIFKEKQMLSKLFNWLFSNKNEWEMDKDTGHGMLKQKKSKSGELAAWPFPVADDFEKTKEAPKVTRKPKAKKATTATKKKAPAKAKAKATTTKTKKTTTKKPSK